MNHLPAGHHPDRLGTSSPRTSLHDADAADDAVLRRRVGDVIVLDAAGPPAGVAAALDRAIAAALADGPRGVVCCLRADVPGPVSDVLRVLAGAARHVRHWPAVPVAVACPNQRTREALSAHPASRAVPVAASTRLALAAVLRSGPPAVEARRLPPHPTSPRAGRDFAGSTLVGWRLSHRIPAVALVVSELVTNAMVHAGTDIHLSIACHRGAVRVAVRDGDPDLPVPRAAHLDANGRGLDLVAALSRAWGVLPTADGGKVVWAVLDDHPS